MAPDPGKSAEYVVVARRYRPQLFEELVGQQQVSQALVNAITTNRVGHAYLFTGARGVGKTSAARIFAKALDCAEGPSPRSCNQCDICQSIATGDDIDVLEIDGASNRGIDEIRQLRSNVNIRPSRARFKIYIIDEVHMLTTQAFNALLKTLEEPPPSCQLFLVTSRPDMLLDTVRSRCPQLRFGPLSVEAIVRLLMVVSGFDEHAARAAAVSAGGSLRRAQQTGAGDFVAAREAAVELLETVSKGPDSRARLASAKILFARSGSRRTAGVERRELRFRLDALASLIRDMEVVASRASEPLANADLEKCLRRLAADFGRGRGIRAFSIVDRAMEAVASNASPKVVADWIVCNL